MPPLHKAKIKICGIKNLNTLICCIENNIDFFGLVFYRKSLRYISINKAIELTKYTKHKKIKSVGVFVNEPINNLNNIQRKVNLKFIQLHGEEDNKYIINIKKKFSVKIIKNIPISSDKDFLKINQYLDADFFLFDYKPQKSELPGGNAKKFSWNLLKNIKMKKPWFISGGININNINEIKNYTIPYGIDISSGVEEKPGIKNNEKIKSLIKYYDPH